MKKVKQAAAVLTAFLSACLLVSCSGGGHSTSSGQKASSSPVDQTSGIAEDTPDAQVVHEEMDRRMFNNLADLEDASDAIVECVGQKKLGQNVGTYYNPKLKENLPTVGYTFWGMKVTKVFKGNVKPGDQIPFAQAYYLWTESDGVTKRICSTSQKPVQVGREYLLFLLHDENHNDYVAAGDYQGKYAGPSDELKTKGLAGTVTQSDLDMYDDEQHSEIQSIYKDVVQKYFS